MLARPWGNRGELAANPLGSRSGRFQALREVFLLKQGAIEPERFEIESAWEHRGRPILKFRGIDTISAAEALAGAEVRVPGSERAPLPEGEFYQSDLVGCQVVDRNTGERLGVVTGWQEAGGPGLLVVQGIQAEEEVLIPFARSICVEIDVSARRIVVDLPKGLKELSRE